MPNLEINMDLNTETGSIFLSTPTASGCSYYVDTRRSKEEIAHECAAYFENYLLNELYGEGITLTTDNMMWMKGDFLTNERWQETGLYKKAWGIYEYC